MKTIESCKICSNTSFENHLNVKDYFLSMEDFQLQKCSNCGFVFTNPHPDETAISAYYKSDDYVSHSDTRRGIFFKLYHLVKTRALKNKYKLIKKFVSKGKILDYGCGSGDFLGLLNKYNWECLGVEPDDKTRAYATEKHQLNIIAPNDINIETPEKFDVITLWHVLEHIPDLNEKLQLFHKLLKPNGVIIIAVPNCDSYDAKYYEKFWAAYDVPRHLHHFNQKTLTNLLEINRFNLSSKNPMPFDSFYVSILSEKYKRSALGFFKGSLIGLLSNIKASKNFNYSSVVYTFQKKPI